MLYDMKQFHLIISLVFTVFAVNAQDWMPYVYEQTTYFEQTQDENLKIEMFLTDSVEINGEETYYYFNYKYPIDTCHGDVSVVLEMHQDQLLNKPSFMQLRNDSILFPESAWGDGDVFIFKPFVVPGESWNTNGTNIVCDDVIESEFLGIVDSVKSFHCEGGIMDGGGILLSKHHGFIDYVPIGSFWHSINQSNFELVGLKTSADQIGYEPADFSDFFHLQPTDMLFWSSSYEPYDISQPSTGDLYVDSIKSVYNDGDSVAYFIHRRVYRLGELLATYENHIEIYTRNTYDRYIVNPTACIGIAPDDFGEALFFKDAIDLTVMGEDSLQKIVWHKEGFILYDDCEIGCICDYMQSFQLSTKTGLNRIWGGDFGGTSNFEVTGYIIDGEHWGNTDIPMHVGIAEVANVFVSPNPARCSLKVQTENVDVESLQLLDLNARVLKTCEATNVMRINEIPTGVYVLVVQLNNGKTYRQQVMKVE